MTFEGIYYFKGMPFASRLSLARIKETWKPCSSYDFPEVVVVEGARVSPYVARSSLIGSRRLAFQSTCFPGPYSPRLFPGLFVDVLCSSRELNDISCLTWLRAIR